MRFVMAFFVVGCGSPSLVSPEVEQEVLALDGDPVAGEQVFEAHCGDCHWGNSASALLCDEYMRITDLGAQDFEDIVLQVLNGDACMPAFGEGAGGDVELTAIEVADVAAYVDVAW